MDPLSAITAITSLSGLFGKLHSLGENLIDAKKDFDKFQTWCWLYKVQVALIIKWAEGNSEALQKVGKIDTRKLFNKVLKNITRILSSLEKLLNEVPDKSKGNFRRRVGVVSIGPDALKTIGTLDGLMSQVKNTMTILDSTNGVTRESAKAKRNPSQNFDDGLWKSLEVTPTKDLDVVVTKLFDHLNMKVLNAEGERAIHIASRMENLPILDSLLRHGAVTDVIDVHKQTPLHLALRFQRRQTVEKLLNHSDTSLSMQDDIGHSPLHIALNHELEDIAINLIPYSQTSLYVADNEGMFPLHTAAKGCLPDAMRKILEHYGAMNVDQRTIHGRTALSLALDTSQMVQEPSEEKRIETLRILLRHGADITQSTITRGSASLPALHYLARRGEIDVLKEVEASWANIINVRYEPHADALGSATDESLHLHGGTPLYLAALNENLETVRFLLEKGANPNIGLSAGSSSFYAPTPLWAALIDNCVDIAQELLSYGASPNFIWEGDHLIHYMIGRGSAQCRTEIVGLLLKYDADFLFKDKHEEVPLVYAARKGCIASLNALWNAYASLEYFHINVVDALIVACQEGHHSCVVLLYAKGVDINVKTKHGYTPLHYAARYDQYDVVNVLLPMGADCTAVAPTRQEPFEAAGTAEDIARASGHVTTADLIQAWVS